MKVHLLRAAAFGILINVLTTSSVVRGAEDEGPAASDAQLAKDLIGLWIRVPEPDALLKAPASRGRFKFCTSGHWTITQADLKTGVTTYHHGGTYTLNGSEYTETVEYANKNTADLIKQTFKYTIKIEGDTLTQTGIGNPWTEVWKRVK